MITLADTADAPWAALQRANDPNTHLVYRYGVYTGYVRTVGPKPVGYRITGDRFEHPDFRLVAEYVANGRLCFTDDEEADGP